MADLSLTNAVKLIVQSDKQINSCIKKYGNSSDFTVMEIIKNNAYYDILVAMGYTVREIAIAKEIVKQEIHKD